jgi:hypothetical protein
MKQKLMAVASAAVIGLTAVAIPNNAEANWRGGWWVPGAPRHSNQNVGLRRRS